MELSTSEFVAESIYASSVGGLCGIGPTSASSLEVGPGARLVEAWLADPRIQSGYSSSCQDVKGVVILQITIIT